MEFENEIVGSIDSTKNRGLLFLAGLVIHEGTALRVMEGHALSQDTILRAFLDVPDNHRSPS